MDGQEQFRMYHPRPGHPLAQRHEDIAAPGQQGAEPAARLELTRQFAPVFGNNWVAVTRKAAQSVADAFNSMVSRGEDRRARDAESL